MVSRFSRWPPRRPYWKAELNDFSDSESLRCFPLNPTYGLGGVVVEDGGHLIYRSGTILAILNLHVARFRSIRLTVWEYMTFEEFQDCRHGGHLGYRNRTILAILNLYLAPMPPILCRLNLTNDLVGYVV